MSMLAFFDKLANAPYMPTARTWLLGALGVLLVLSLMMVASASIPFAMSREGFSELKFFWSQFIYMAIAIVAALCVYQAPLKHQFDFKTLTGAFFACLGLLVVTLLVGENINGAKRWISFGGMSFQTAEMAKVLMVMVIAECMHRRSAELRHRNIFVSGRRLLVWYAPVMLLLFLQPDYGSVVVIGATVLVMFFVAGVPFLQYVLLALVALLLGFIGLWQAEYRQSRLLSFQDPFDDVLDTDYQLSRSLIAFGRGEFSGVGYGNSVQKLEHLPEAHTDFLLAITGEELGFLGVALVILLEFIIIAAIMRISYNCLSRRQLKLSYATFGFAVVLFGQVMINAGMNMGILPTKGLTMPFYSYGGSAMLFSMIVIAVVLRVDKESPLIAKAGENREY